MSFKNFGPHHHHGHDHRHRNPWDPPQAFPARPGCDYGKNPPHYEEYRVVRDDVYYEGNPAPPTHGRVRVVEYEAGSGDNPMFYGERVEAVETDEFLERVRAVRPEEYLEMNRRRY